MTSVHVGIVAARCSERLSQLLTNVGLRDTYPVMHIAASKLCLCPRFFCKIVCLSVRHITVFCSDE